MMVDQNVTSSALDGGDVVSMFGWSYADDVSEALGVEFDDPENTVLRAFMPPSASPAWPRVYPGL